MSAEAEIYTALVSLAGGRVFADLAPPNMQALPRITYQQVGGASVNFLDQATIPNKRNARMQINVWASTRQAASELSQQVETAIRAAPLQATVLGAPVAVFEPTTELYGTHQDFSVWSN